MSKLTGFEIIAVLFDRLVIINPKTRKVIGSYTLDISTIGMVILFIHSLMTREIVDFRYGTIVFTREMIQSTTKVGNTTTTVDELVNTGDYSLLMGRLRNTRRVLRGLRDKTQKYDIIDMFGSWEAFQVYQKL